MIPDSLRIEQLGDGQAMRALSSSLGLSPDASPEDVTYEVLRAVAWASTRGRIPVSTRTLLDRAMDAHATSARDATDERALRRILRGRLDMLAAIGDLAPLGRGRWLSAPGCLVRLDDSDDLLLVSGIPLRQLNSTATICSTGPTRTLDRRAADLLDLPVIGLDDWSRIPRRPLAAWTRELLASAPTRGDFAADAYTTRYYAPDLSDAHTSQQHRWMIRNARLSGVRVARANTFGRWTDYAVVGLDAGRVIDVRGVSLRDVRRLMYGLDQQYGRSTTATVTTLEAGTRLRLGSPLPNAETRALLAMGSLPESTGWMIPRHTPTVRHMLDDLGIKLSDTP